MASRQAEGSFDPERAKEIAEAFSRERGSLLPLLHALQEEFGYIDPAAVPIIAAAINWSRADVHGVVTFYKDFHGAPQAGRVIKLCGAEACQAQGGDDCRRHFLHQVGLAADGTTADGRVTVETVYCLGNCALGPSALIDGVPLGRATPEALLAASRARPVGLTRPVATPVPEGAVTLFVPQDSAALSVGADEVAAALAAEAARRGIPVNIVRNGSRGLLWLEPLVEVATPAGRVAYGPVTAGDVASLFDAGLAAGGAHRLCHGPTEEIPYLKSQQRLTFARVGVVDPLSPEDYEAHGGIEGLRRALEMPPAAVVNEVTASGLRGRGGAGFPTGIKWKTVLEAQADEKFVACNADEGDSGTYADRMLMEGDPFAVVEGMTIAGLATGATRGYLYIRSEYPHAVATMRAAIHAANARGWLGTDILGSGRAFVLEVRMGAGAYVCGEETSMLESLEGKRGQVRPRPPLPAIEGLFGKPTVVNNLLTLATVPVILAKGGKYYAGFGAGRSRGTQAFQLAGNLKRGGLVELAFGVSLRTLLEEYGGGSRSGRPLRAVQAGGPLGSYLPAAQFDIACEYETLAAAGGLLGHGGLVAFDDTVDMANQARFALEFCAEESCGKCTPCRIGARRGVETIDKIRAGTRAEANIALLQELCEVMEEGSLCALGGLTPLPVKSALRHFREDFFRVPANQA